MEIEFQPLPPTRQEPFLVWLHNDQFEVLIGVLKSLALEKEVEALNSRFKAEGDTFPKYEVAAQSAAREADKFHAAVKILTEVQQKTVHNLIIPKSP